MIGEPLVVTYFVHQNIYSADMVPNTAELESGELHRLATTLHKTQIFEPNNYPIRERKF